MSDLIKQVTPLTRAILWIVKEDVSARSPHYDEIDYLLDGLLTRNLGVNGEVSSRVIVGENFNRPIYIMIMKEFKSSEIESFISLFNKDLGPENDIIVIDESEQLPKMKNELKSISANIKLLS